MPLRTITPPIGTVPEVTPLAKVIMSGIDAVALGGEGVAEAAEAGDDLVEDQQDAVLVADLAQALQIALRRRQHAGRARHRLDDDGGDGRGVVQRDDALEFVGEMRAPFRLALGEGLLLRGCRCAAGGRRRPAARRTTCGWRRCRRPRCRRSRRRDSRARGRSAASCEPLPRDVPVGERDLQRGVDRLRARIAEEHVVEIARRQRRDAARELERLRDGRTGRPARNRVRRPAPGSPATIGSRLWPALQHHRPAEPSRIGLPSGV